MLLSCPGNIGRCWKMLEDVGRCWIETAPSGKHSFLPLTGDPSGGDPLRLLVPASRCFFKNLKFEIEVSDIFKNLNFKKALWVFSKISNSKRQFGYLGKSQI